MGTIGGQGVLLQMIFAKYKISIQLALSILVIGVASSFALGQTAVVRPFEPGEQLAYKAEISRSLLKKIDVATFRFQVEELALNAHAEAPPAFKFIGDVASEGFFTKLFNVKFHQHVESTVNANSLVVQKTFKLDEQGKRIRTSEATFDSKTNKVVWVERDPNDPSKAARTQTGDFSGTVQDVVSAIYYLRTQKLDPGTSFEMEISDSGRVYKVPVRVSEKKRMKTAIGKIDAVNVVPQVFGEGALLPNTKGELSIWLSDDRRHIPVKAQFKGEYGTFDITLKQVTQLSAPAK